MNYQFELPRAEALADRVRGQGRRHDSPQEVLPCGLLIAILLHSATNVAGVVLLKDARSDFGPAVLATVLTVALAVAAARHLQGGDAELEARPSVGDP